MLCALFITTFSFAAVFNGYTLFTPNVGGQTQQGIITFLMDNDYNIVHSWQHENSPASMPYLIHGNEPGFEHTQLIYPYKVSNPTMTAGGVGGGVACYSWDGVKLWDFVLSDDTYQHHHDVEPLPNGNVLLIAWERKDKTASIQAGRLTFNSDLEELWSEAIIEIKPNGTGGADIVWEWHLWDHLIQDVDATKDNYGVVSEHPELFDINNGNAGNQGGQGGPTGDWIHLNSIHYNPIYDQIVLSSRFQDELYVIDHSTSTSEAAGHTGGNSGKGGDIIYRWGNPENYDRGDSSHHLLADQHSVNWIPEGFPGEGNLIIFNNGTQSAIEIVPPVDAGGHYIMEEGEPYGPTTVIWSSPYVETVMQGGAFRLPNGNSFLTDSDDATIIEVSPEGDELWTYSHDGVNYIIARAQKYALDHFDVVSPSVVGDFNFDDEVTVEDILPLINLILSSSTVDYADLNGDSVVDLLDVMVLVSLITL